MRWIYRLELKYPKFQIPYLSITLLVGMVLVLVLDLFVGAVNPLFIGLLELDRSAILQGEVWRLLTFIFIPGTFGVSISSAFYFYFFYFVSTTLERRWTPFRYSLYFILGVVCSIISMFITGYGSNYYIFLSFILAYITIDPEAKIYIFYILPIKTKWLGILYALGIAFNLITAFSISTTYGLQSLVGVLFGLVPYFIFFSSTLINMVTEAVRTQRNRDQWRKKNK